jgi:hypothetical protein
MAITLPNLWNSVHRPIIYTFAPEYTFVAAGNYLGNLQLIISPLSNVDNFIVGTNAIIPSGIYAGTHKVLSISGNALLLDTTYTAGAGGTVISTRVPVNLYAGYDAAHPGFTDYPYGLVASITAIRGADGNCKVDVSGFLKSVFKEIKAPRIGRDFQMSIPFALFVGLESHTTRYALNGTFKQDDLAAYDAAGKILNAREPIHFQNGKTIYSMIWQDTAEFGEHIVNIAATPGTGNVGGIGFLEIGTTFTIQ